MCFTMESPIIQIYLRGFLFLFSFSWGSLIFAFDVAIVSDVSIFLLQFKSLFPFQWRADFVKSVFFCVGRMRFVLIDSTKVVLFFRKFWIVSYFYFVFLILEASFPFLEKRFLFPEYYYSESLLLSNYQFLWGLIISWLTLTLMMKPNF